MPSERQGEPGQVSQTAARTIEDVAAILASGDHRPARVRAYLTPLRELERRCRGGSVTVVSEAVGRLASALWQAHLDVPPGATAAKALAADVRQGTDCAELGAAIAAEVTSRLHGSVSLYSGAVRFSPPLVADLALAAIRHSLLPGRVHVVYALKAFSCQQAIFMGRALGRRYGNSSLGAFVELTSGRGVGHGKYDPKRVNRARITSLGRIGGQPCT